MNAQTITNLLGRLEEVHQLCPDMRFGQLIATIALLAEDATGRSLWDLEDQEFESALEHFEADLSRRS